MPKKSEKPREIAVGSKITEEEEQQLKDLVKLSGLTRSDLIRKAILGMFAKVPMVMARVGAQIPRMVKEGTLTPQALSEMYSSELDRAAIDQISSVCDDVIQKKNGKKKKSFLEELGDKAATL
jgi:hypothetical protein